MQKISLGLSLEAQAICGIVDFPQLIQNRQIEIQPWFILERFCSPQIMLLRLIESSGDAVDIAEIDEGVDIVRLARKDAFELSFGLINGILLRQDNKIMAFMTQRVVGGQLQPVGTIE
jgi:hypothetical protein